MSDGTEHILVREFIPAVADCRLQGTAGSPTSAALSKVTLILYYKIPTISMKIFLYKIRKCAIIQKLSAKTASGGVAQLGVQAGLSITPSFLSCNSGATHSVHIPLYKL